MSGEGGSLAPEGIHIDDERAGSRRDAHTHTTARESRAVRLPSWLPAGSGARFSRASLIVCRVAVDICGMWGPYTVCIEYHAALLVAASSAVNRPD